jgi:hypothetical protein
LNHIIEDHRLYALAFLRWPTYVKSPPSLDQLREVGVINPADDPAVRDVVDVDNRGGWGDALEILVGYFVKIVFLVVGHTSLQGHNRSIVLSKFSSCAMWKHTLFLALLEPGLLAKAK